jgi:formylglycine-generating enzyme required for sulfatase activity
MGAGPGRAGLVTALACASALVVLGAVVERVDPFPRLRFAIQRDARDLQSTKAVDPREIVRGYPTASLSMAPATLQELLDHKHEHGRAWERPAFFSYFDGGQARFGANVGVRIHGGGSRITSPRQSFRIFLRRDYGLTRAPEGVLLDRSSHPLRRLVLHNDVRRGRDRVSWHLVNPLAYDFARRVGCITPETRPVRFFLNGELQGLYVLTEHFDDEYFEAHMPGRRISMPIAAMEALRERIDTMHPLTMAAAGELLDLENVTRWFLAVLFSATRDAYQGPGQFLDEGRQRAPWFWVTWDLDESFRDWDLDSFHYLLDPVGGRPRGRRDSEPRATVLTRLIAGDAEYRSYLAERIDDMLNHQLAPAFVAERASHYEEIAAAYGARLEYVPRLRMFLDKRPAFVRLIAEQWLNTPPSVAVSIRRAGGGPLVVDGFDAPSTYRGAYFPGRQLIVRLPEGVPSIWYINGERAADGAELRVTADRPLAITSGGAAEAADRPPLVVAAPRVPAPPAAPLVWRRIQGDGFTAGCISNRDQRCHPGELPRERMRLTHVYQLTATEVTVAQFRAHARQVGVAVPRQPRWSTDLHPVVNVTWNEALTFCKAAGGRLPTETEWEFAARAGQFADIFPWGDAFSPDRANGAGLGGADRWEFAAPAGSYPPNPHGLFDMTGNVWEWTSSWYREGKGWTDPPSAAPAPRSSADLRAVRGGSWDSSPQNLRISRRVGLSPSDRHNLSVGFRCARDGSAPSATN